MHEENSRYGHLYYIVDENNEISSTTAIADDEKHLFIDEERCQCPIDVYAIAHRYVSKSAAILIEQALEPLITDAIEQARKQG